MTDCWGVCGMSELIILLPFKMLRTVRRYAMTSRRTSSPTSSLALMALTPWTGTTVRAASTAPRAGAALSSHSFDLQSVLHPLHFDLDTDADICSSRLKTLHSFNDCSSPEPSPITLSSLSTPIPPRLTVLLSSLSSSFSDPFVPFLHLLEIEGVKVWG